MYKLILCCCALYGFGIESMEVLPAVQPEKTMVYISNIPFGWDANKLKSILNVSNVRVPLDRSGRSTGIAFAELPHGSSIEECTRKLSERCNRTLVINVMTPVGKRNDNVDSGDTIIYSRDGSSWQSSLCWQGAASYDDDCRSSFSADRRLYRSQSEGRLRYPSGKKTNYFEGDS